MADSTDTTTTPPTEQVEADALQSADAEGGDAAAFAWGTLACTTLTKGWAWILLLPRSNAWSVQACPTEPKAWKTDNLNTPTARPRLVFGYTPICGVLTSMAMTLKIFHPSHQIFRYMHETLNIDKKKKN
jgi:hypothetical protein